MRAGARPSPALPAWAEALCGAVKPYRDMELERIYGALHAREDHEARTAFCISGGGIRSATFALGVIQGLAGAMLMPTVAISGWVKT